MRSKHGSLTITLGERRSTAEAWVVEHTCRPDGKGVRTPFAFRRSVPRGEVIALVAAAVQKTLDACECEPVSRLVIPS